ncbi:hypothetical protein acdb102_03770 [Acidothermaceae bacterium B102]|nr:hypothetical protein acdb102_03770 [Acidothermaceae bacterium B102]
MNSNRHRTMTRLLTGGATAGLLIAATATGAQASTTSFAHVTTASALAALPGTAGLPAGVKLIGKVEVTKALIDEPCGSKVDAVPLTGSADVAAIYSTAKSTKVSATDSVWTISEAVFATPAAAKADTIALVTAQTKCPRVQTATSNGVTATLTRTVSAPDTSEKGLWKGYRTVAHLTASTSAKGDRVFGTYFERGNVVVKVEELAPLAGDNAQQDQLRKAVVVTTLAKLDALP